MYLQELKLSNFKNCQSADLSLSEKINCFVGLNAAGKTNILDSIYYLAFCKSYFTLTDRQNIRHGEEFFAIHGDFHFDNDELHTISCVQKAASKKSFKCDKKEYERLADHIGKIPLVMISPYDSDLINNGSELRRKFIDGVISQFDASYLSCLLNYNKALQQRNKQLKYFSENRITGCLRRCPVILFLRGITLPLQNIFHLTGNMCHILLYTSGIFVIRILSFRKLLTQLYHGQKKFS